MPVVAAHGSRAGQAATATGAERESFTQPSREALQAVRERLQGPRAVALRPKELHLMWRGTPAPATCGRPGSISIPFAPG